jgi:hypothetical protein
VGRTKVFFCAASTAGYKKKTGKNEVERWKVSEWAGATKDD